MNKQYEMISTLQRMFNPNTIGDVRRLKLEFLIYRLKRLLLMRETYSFEEMEMICPMHELEELKTLFVQMKTIPDSLEQLENGFKRIIARMESLDLPTGCNSRVNC